MSNHPTLYEILNRIDTLKTADNPDGNPFFPGSISLEEAKRQLTQLIADIIGPRPNDGWYDDISADPLLACGDLLDWQTERAKERGIDLKAGDAN